MTEFFYEIDVVLFRFCNQTLANPVFDFIMPPITNWNQSAIGITVFVLIWLFIFIGGGKRGRIAAILLIPLIFISDQLSSSVIKEIVARPRPCHEINGAMILSDMRLLVPCGSGYSFPSSHAVNNFAFATFMTLFYNRIWYLFFSYAGLMGFSRMSVGVHYPSDILGGAIIGAILALIIFILWKILSGKYQLLELKEK